MQAHLAGSLRVIGSRTAVHALELRLGLSIENESRRSNRQAGAVSREELRPRRNLAWKRIVKPLKEPNHSRKKASSTISSLWQ
jgi:hypothetical protein